MGIKHIDSKRALIGFTSCHQPNQVDLIPEGSTTGAPEPRSFRRSRCACRIIPLLRLPSRRLNCRTRVISRPTSAPAGAERRVASGTLSAEGSITASNLNECVRTFLPTDGLLELGTRILEAISKKIGERSKALQEPASILLTGGHGVGKSHLLSTVFSLISQKGAWTQGLNDPRVQSNIAAVREMDPLCI